MRNVFEFLNDLAEAGSQEERLAVLDRHLRALGFAGFAYIAQCRAPSALRMEGSFPAEWVRVYRDNGYLKEDLVVQTARHTLLPFRWQPLYQSPRMTPLQRRILHEAEGFGLHDGLAIPLHGTGVNFGLLLAATPGPVFPRAMETAKHLAHLMALHFHEACQAAQRPATEEPPVELSPRETECLKWIAKGKTAWEISRILRISERTAVYHIENAKHKLGVTTRNHAVTKALTLGLIVP